MDRSLAGLVTHSLTNTGKSGVSSSENPGVVGWKSLSLFWGDNNYASGIRWLFIVPVGKVLELR